MLLVLISFYSIVNNYFNDIYLNDIGFFSCIVFTVYHQTISLKLCNSSLKPKDEFMLTINLWKLPML